MAQGEGQRAAPSQGVHEPQPSQSMNNRLQRQTRYHTQNYGVFLISTRVSLGVITLLPILIDSALECNIFYFFIISYNIVPAMTDRPEPDQLGCQG